MAFGRMLRRRAQAAIAPVIFLSLVAYFGWNATQGEHGLVASAERRQLLAQARADEQRAEAERDRWEQRVAGLRGNHLDRDTLDERARLMLNRSDPGDVILSLPKR